MIKTLKILQKKGAGFTLIEVMVVIAMIGILAAIAVPIFTSYVYRARASEGVTALGAIRTFMIERRAATGTWPTTQDVKDEFNGLTELFYFDSDTLTVISDPNTARVTLPADLDNFDSPDLNKSNEAYISVEINWTEASCWDGDVVRRYATHLKPLCP